MAKILIADIEPDVNDAMKDMFESMGNTVYTANSKDEAINAIRKYKPDIVSIDVREKPYWNMRLDVLKKIKEIDKNIKIFVVTTFDANIREDEAQIRAIGVEDCMEKPIDMTKFAEKLKEVKL